MANNNSPDNESVYNTPPEELFPVFPYDDPPIKTQPQDLYPVFPRENFPETTPPELMFPPVNILPVNNPTETQPPKSCFQSSHVTIHPKIPRHKTYF